MLKGGIFTTGLVLGCCTFVESTAAETNLQVAIDSSTTGTVALELGWPVSFTNKLEFFATTNLAANNWVLACTNISTANAASYTWIDVATNMSARFYIAANADLDTDSDWLSDAREIYIHKTLRDIWDTDGDGLWDGFEIANGFDPLSLPGASEADADEDGDGLPDPLELLYFGDLDQNATNDWDGDGLLNEEEFSITKRHDDPYPIDSSWVAAPSNAATVVWSNNDEGFASLDVGFDFPFLGINYSNLYAGINGTCSFGTAYGAWNGVSLLPNGNGNALAAPFWSDLQIIHGSVRYFSHTNSPVRSFVVLWEDVSFYGKSASSLNFQTELFEDGSLEFRYGEMNFAGVSSATSIGIQGHNGIDGKSWRYSSNVSEDVTNGLALFFPARVSMINLASYPNETDGDGDGIGDKYEAENRLLNPLDTGDASRDWDFDGLSNLFEYQNGTEFDLADSDGDGFSDGFEVVYGFDPTNPLEPDRALLTDADGDGMADLWEIHYLGTAENDAEGNLDGDSLLNGQEYLVGTNPFTEDTDGDGLNDSVDTAPLSSGPRVFFEQPQEGASVQGNSLFIKGTVKFRGVLDSVRIGNREAVLSDTDGCWRFSATINMPPEGYQTLQVTASGHRQTMELEGRTRLPVFVDSQAPRLAVLSTSSGAPFDKRLMPLTVPTDDAASGFADSLTPRLAVLPTSSGASFENLFMHLTVQTDDAAPVFADGTEMARDGFISYAWVELTPGLNTVVVASTDKQERTTSKSFEVYCDVPPGYTEDPPVDTDKDGVLDALDSAPYNPSISGSISFSSHENGSIVVASMGSLELDEERTFLLKGKAGANSRMKITTHPVNTLRGCDREYPVVAGKTGLFEQEIKLFPGTNEIFTTCGTERNWQVINFEVPVSPIEFQARWGPGGLRMLGTASVGPNWGRGSDDVTWLDGEFICECTSPVAGAYKSTMKTYRFRELWYRSLYPDDSITPGGSASMDMVHDGNILYSESIEFPYICYTGSDYHVDTLDVALFQTGSVAVHSGNGTGGYIVDSEGKRDMAPQGTYIGQSGWNTFTYDPEPGNQWAGDVITNYTLDLVLTGPEETDDIVIPAGGSAQFQATGTFRREMGGAPNDKLCSIFAVDAVESSLENAFIDSSGVFTAMKGGYYRIGIKYSAVLKNLTQCYTTNDVPPINVYAIDPPKIVPDYNRDGAINEADAALAEAGVFHRFWVNDDDDSGDIAEDGSDVPGQGGLFDNANYEDSVVNGRCDLPDFFPIWIDLHDTLSMLPAGGGVEYKLRHDDEAVRFVYTDLTTDQANAYLMMEGNTYGSSFSQNAFAAKTIKVTDSGIALSPDFLNRILNDPDKGVLMVEAIKPTTAPLVLEIWKDGGKLIEGELNLSLSGVENMYRWINLRSIAGGNENRATDMSEPSNFPDSSSNGKNFVFVHGYSVHEEAARAWNAEMFKRLYQSGSRAMFTAVTWRGNDSQIWSWIPFVGGSTPDYYENVENAFATAPHLVAQLNTLPGEKVIAGHSLGNMVVSSAIKDYGLNVNAYFMLNAAVAMEAYNETFSDQELMRHPDWQNYSNRLWSTEWHALFPASDSRSELTWGGRFKGILNAVNYFSSTEDVLDNANGSIPPIDKEQAWVCQEMRKGTTLMWIAPGNTEAGWGFNTDYDILVEYDPPNQTIYDRMPPSHANVLPNSAIQTNSFFYPFDDEELYSETGSAFLLNGEADVRNSATYSRLLADAIPSLSNPAGRNSLGSAVLRNRDYMSYGDGTGFRRGLYENGDWPRDDDRWWHSDIKNIAFPYNHEAYEQIVTDGGLK